jgi:hypothetical protein
MKKIILHCGMPKTGSSALQVQLSQGRDALLSVGFDYLQMGDFALGAQGKINSGNGVGLARAYLPSHHQASLWSRRDEQIQKFLKVIRTAEGHVILSSEFFSVIPPAAMHELVAALSTEGEVELIFIVRNQLNFLASAYIQQVKRHGLQQFPDEYFADWTGYKRPITYYAYFHSLQQACPGIRISARAYEHSRDYPLGLMGLFLDLIGAQVPASGLAVDKKINLSPSPKEIRIMLEVNKHHPRMRFSDMLVEGSARAGRARIHAQHEILPPAFRNEVRSHFREDNQKFFEQIVKDDNIYDADIASETYVDLRAVTFDAADVVDILSGILVDIDKRLALLEGE